MNKYLTLLVASTFALSTANALAADPPKETAPAKKVETAPPQKPADISAEAWAKMSDADKAKAAEKAKLAEKAPAKKEKKGGC
jgi:hypothetical protein